MLLETFGAKFCQDIQAEKRETALKMLNTAKNTVSNFFGNGFK